MQHLDWKSAFKRNIILLKCLGLWPAGDETYKPNLYTVYAIVSITFLIFCNALTGIISIFSAHSGIQEIMSTFFVALTITVGALKSYYVVRNMDTLKNLMTTMNSEVFQVKNQRQLALTEPNINSWRFAHTVYSGTVAIAGIFFDSSPMWDPSFEKYQLPVTPWWFPFDYRSSPYYEIAYTYQVAGAIFDCILMVNVDTLVAALNVFVGTQCDILCDDLRHISEFNDMLAKLKKCISHHKAILRFFEDSKSFYEWLVLFQIFSTVLIISTTMVQLTMVAPFGSEFFTYILYIQSMLIQIFVYCWFGNEVEVKSSNISYAAFESDWPSAPLEFKKDLVLIILRSQKPIKVSALNLFYLSLENFMAILRTAWSYFAVLQQVKDEN